MKKRNKLAKLDNILKKAAPEDIEKISVDGIEVKGKDIGEYLILKHILFQPNYAALKKDGITDQNKIMEIAKSTLERNLFEYCQLIGWWPKDNLDPYRISLEKDGYTLAAHLKRDRKNPKAKTINEISDKININEK